jgi:hypothetical protein
MRRSPASLKVHEKYRAKLRKGNDNREKKKKYMTYAPKDHVE